MQRRILVTLLLAALGAALGAGAAPILSALATAVARALIDERSWYGFHPIALAVLGAVGIPLLAWLVMRRVPLWRAVAEPVVGAIAGLLLALASASLLPLSPSAQTLLMFGGLFGGAVAAAWRLRKRHQLPTAPAPIAVASQSNAS
jgi:hypothetical protein